MALPDVEQPDDIDADDVRLSPTEGWSESERLTRSRLDPPDNSPSASGDRGGLQFTLSTLLVIVFFVCVGLMAAQWTPALASLFAGIVGLLTLLSIFWADAILPDSPISRAIWAGIVIAYFLACCVAVARFAG